MYAAIAIHRKKSQYSFQLLLICILLTIISWIDWSSFVIINVIGLAVHQIHTHIRGSSQSKTKKTCCYRKFYSLFLILLTSVKSQCMEEHSEAMHGNLPKIENLKRN